MATPDEIAAQLPGMLRTLEAGATRHETPCGEGTMVWHVWGEGPVILLLHGGAGSWHHWVRNIEVLMANSYKVVAADLPGFGDSANAPDPHTPDQFAEIVAAGLDELVGQETNYDIVGFSFGGLIGAHLAAARPRQTRSLTIIGTGGLAELPNNDIDFVRLRDKTPEEQVEVHRTNLNRMMIADRDRIDDLALAIHIRNARLTRVRSPALYALGRLSAIIGGLDGPVNGIWGEADPTATPRVREREAVLRRLNPDVQFAVIAKAGHWVQFEAADAFNRTLLGMLKRSRPTA